MRGKEIKTPRKVLWDCSEGRCLLRAWRGPGPFSWGRTREFSASTGLPQQRRGQDPLWHLFRRVAGRLQQVERMSSFLLTLVPFLEWREDRGSLSTLGEFGDCRNLKRFLRGGPGVAGGGAEMASCRAQWWHTSVVECRDSTLEIWEERPLH